jgi:hypothetical protein
MRRDAEMLKLYMGYSSFAGSIEGAALIFANSSREAKKVGWRETAGMFTDEYIDFAVNRIRGHEWLYKEAEPDKLANDIAHVIVDVRSCDKCETWGQSEINENGLCESCNDDLEAVNDD